RWLKVRFLHGPPLDPLACRARRLESAFQRTSCVRGLMHLVSLQQAAGVESHFTEFVIQARAARPDWTQGWLNPSRKLHPYFAVRLREPLAQRIDAKYWHGIKVPSPLRTARCRRALRRARTDSLVIWNRSAKLRYALDAAGDERCIHWEH